MATPGWSDGDAPSVDDLVRAVDELALLATKLPRGLVAELYDSLKPRLAGNDAALRAAYQFLQKQ